MRQEIIQKDGKAYVRTTITDANGTRTTEQEMQGFGGFQQMTPEQQAEAKKMAKEMLKKVGGMAMRAAGEAIKQGVHTDEKTALSMALAQRNTLADALLDKVVKERTTDERVQKAYEEQAVRFARPQANIRVIVLETAEAGAEVKALLDGGADFAKLATERSKDPRTAPKGGEAGWIEKSAMGPMGEQVFAGEKGQVVGPIDTPQGSLLFKIEDKRDKTPLEDVREELEASLKQEIAQEYIEEVKGAATITEAGATGATVAAPDAAAPAADAAAPAADAAAPAADAGKAGK